MKFVDVGYWKNDRNRIFTVFAPDTNWVTMELYARKKMHTTGRVTSVFFFNDRTKTPDVTLIKGLWADVIDYIYDSEYASHCVARYDKWPTGHSGFYRYPTR